MASFLPSLSNLPESSPAVFLKVKAKAFTVGQFQLFDSGICFLLQSFAIRCCALPRSAQFGSPNHRKRCYIVGCRSDIISRLDFMSMCHYIEHVAPQAHPNRVSLMECSLDKGTAHLWQHHFETVSDVRKRREFFLGTGQGWDIPKTVAQKIVFRRSRWKRKDDWFKPCFEDIFYSQENCQVILIFLWKQTFLFFDFGLWTDYFLQLESWEDTNMFFWKGGESGRTIFDSFWFWSSPGFGSLVGSDEIWKNGFAEITFHSEVRGTQTSIFSIPYRLVSSLKDGWGNEEKAFERLREKDFFGEKRPDSKSIPGPTIHRPLLGWNFCERTGVEMTFPEFSQDQRRFWVKGWVSWVHLLGLPKLFSF